MMLNINGKIIDGVISGGTDYQPVAAGQADTKLGAAGKIGDYLEGILVIVATPATAQVTIKDDAAGTAITIFPNSPGGGIGSYFVPLGITSKAGAWHVATGAGASVLAVGAFTAA